jgi:uncharacterized protein YbcI
MSDGRGALEPLEEPSRDGAKSQLLEISNTVVGLHKQFYGRGPTKARSTLVRDVLVVVLEGGYSQAERTLVESGRAETVQSSRQVLQSAVKERWIEAVEALLGRRVRAFVSASDPAEQLQVETFILEPDGTGPERASVHVLESSDGNLPARSDRSQPSDE